MLGLKHCREFELAIDCTYCRFLQNNTILALVTKVSKKKDPKTLHLNKETYLQNVKEDHYECASVLAENNDIYSNFMDILDKYGQLYKSSSNLNIRLR